MGSQRAPGGTPDQDDGWTWVRAAEIAVGTDDNNHFAVVNEDLELGPDSVHLSAAAMKTSAMRVAATVAAAMGLSPRPAAGPQPLSASYERDSGEIVVRFDLRGAARLVGRTAPTGLTGFRAYGGSSGTVLKIASAAIASADTVSLVVDSNLTGVKVEYLGGADPDVSNCLYGAPSSS